MRFAARHGCLFVETSALGNVAVDQAFEELVLRVLDTPSLLAAASAGFGLRQRAPARATAGGCC
jgi:Ras-related protein Rab-18